MGGRYCSLVAGDGGRIRSRCLGLLLLGYPLHARASPRRRRDDHFQRLTMPVLFVSGTRDSLAAQARPHAVGPQGEGAGESWHWLDTADHGFRPLKASGHSAPRHARHGGRVPRSAWVESLA